MKKNPLQNKIIGTYAQASGAALETTLEEMAAFIPDLILSKNYPKVQFYAPGQANITGKAEPDFWAIYRGLPMLFDAKSVGEVSGYSPEKKREHQFDRMRFASERGVFAFYLVYWKPLGMAEIFRVYGDMTWPIRLKPGEGDFRNGDGLWFEGLLKDIRGVFRVTIEEIYKPQRSLSL